MTDQPSTVYKIDKRKVIDLNGIYEGGYRAESDIRKTDFQSMSNLATQLSDFEFEKEFLPVLRRKRVEEREATPVYGAYYLVSEVTDEELAKLTHLFLQKLNYRKAMENSHRSLTAQAKMRSGE